MKSMLRKCLWTAALMMTALAAQAAAPTTDLTGVWQGKLAVDPKTSLTIQFTFGKDAKGAYTAVLNSPDNEALKNTAATGVTWDGTNLKLQVAALSGSYAGAMKDGKLSGQWTQPGSNIPLVLAPYQKPVMSKADMAALTGAWSGPLNIPGGSLTLVMRFKADAKGEMQGTFSIPDQGLNDAPVSNLELANGNLTVKIPQLRGDYTATLAKDQLTGKLKSPSPAFPPDGMPLTLKRGEYAAQTYPLKLTSEQYAALGGKWQGKLEVTAPDGKKISLTIVMRFNTNAGGDYVAFLDSPDQKATNIAVTEFTLTGDKLVAKIAAVRGEYTATLAGKTMTGQWTQGAGPVPLILSKQ